MWSSFSRGDDTAVPMDLSQSLVLGENVEGSEDLVNSAYSHSLNVSQVDFDGGDGGDVERMDDEEELMLDEHFPDERLEEWINRPHLFEGCLLEGQQLQVVKEIGEGAFSTIYLAKTLSGEMVAVKKANIHFKSKFPPEVMFAREVGRFFFLFSCVLNNKCIKGGIFA
jgi:hypothetical protein